MTVSGQFTSWNVSFKNHQWFWAFKSKIRTQKYFPKCLQLNQKWEEIKKNQRARKNMFSMCFVALLTCFRVRCLAGKLDWLMDVGFGVTHTHTRTHPHTHTHIQQPSPRLTSCTWHAGSTWLDIRCHLRDMSLFPFPLPLSPQQQLLFCFYLFICLSCLPFDISTWRAA